MTLLCGAALVSLSALPRVQAQSNSFKTLYNFTAASDSFPYTNSDGAQPDRALLLSGNTMYGTTGSGGSGGTGTVFRVNTNGSGFTNLHCFTAVAFGDYINSDGAYPNAGLLLTNNAVYGTAADGGSAGWGTVFRVNTDGSGFTNLHTFTNGSDGASPEGGLILSGNSLFGTAGTVFRVNIDGSDFTNLHTFTSGSDGAAPEGGLVLSGNTLFGTASTGGAAGNGTVFRVNIDGSDFTNLHSFTALSNDTNNDGADLHAGLVLSGNTLYGTTYQGGSAGGGTVFRLNTDGSGFTNLHSFTAISTPDYTNGDGANPFAGVVLSGATLYGTAADGGGAGWGTVFSVNTDGSAFRTLYSFTAISTDSTTPFGGINSGGGDPAGVILSGNTLYGLAESGGSGGSGTVFALTLGLSAPGLAIAQAGHQVVITWPVSATNYALQTATDLSSASWINITSGIAVIGTNYILTNAASRQAAYFRLQQ